MIDSILSGAIGGVLAWLVGKPIADARDNRLKGLQAAEQNAQVGRAAGVERIVAARAALNDAASALQSISRGHPRLVRLYCRFVGYDCDLEEAASALIRLHNMTGDRTLARGRPFSGLYRRAIRGRLQGLGCGGREVNFGCQDRQKSLNLSGASSV